MTEEQAANPVVREDVTDWRASYEDPSVKASPQAGRDRSSSGKVLARMLASYSATECTRGPSRLARIPAIVLDSGRTLDQRHLSAGRFSGSCIEWVGV